MIININIKHILSLVFFVFFFLPFNIKYIEIITKKTKNGKSSNNKPRGRDIFVWVSFRIYDAKIKYIITKSAIIMCFMNFFLLSPQNLLLLKYYF